jgi:small subunit ribosomal protein S6
MTRPYEAVYVFDSTLEDTAITEKLTRLQELLGNPADLTLDQWGRRQLAYHIGRKDTGYYVVARFTADPSVLPEFERALKLDDGVLRYLISLHEHETGAPPMTEEEAAAAARRQDDDDDDED